MTNSTSSFRAAPAPLVLLLRIHIVQAWRRMKSLRDQSRLLTGVIGLFIVGYLSLSFWLFSKGLKFIAAFLGLGTVLTERLLYLLFAFLGCCAEQPGHQLQQFFPESRIAFLLTLPVPRQETLSGEIIESTLLASWAFVFPDRAHCSRPSDNRAVCPGIFMS